jgi:hypothetical protein
MNQQARRAVLTMKPEVNAAVKATGRHFAGKTFLPPCSLNICVRGVDHFRFGIPGEDPE